MNKIVLLIFYISLGIIPTAFAQNYKGMTCEVRGNDHREFIERLEIFPQNNHFVAVYTPKYYVASESPNKRVLPGKFLVSYVPKEDPRIIEMRSTTEGIHEGIKGKFYDVLLSKEVIERSPGCCGDYITTTVKLKITIERFFTAEGSSTSVKLDDSGLDVSFHPNYCQLVY